MIFQSFVPNPVLYITRHIDNTINTIVVIISCSFLVIIFCIVKLLSLGIQFDIIILFNKFACTLNERLQIARWTGKCPSDECSPNLTKLLLLFNKTQCPWIKIIVDTIICSNTIESETKAYIYHSLLIRKWRPAHEDLSSSPDTQDTIIYQVVI